MKKDNNEIVQTSKILLHAKAVWKSCYTDGCSFEDFVELSQMKCHYCGSPPTNKDRDFTYNGLDRVDNFKDHSLSNVVPCCGKCNFMKGQLSYNDFINQIKKIYRNIPRLSQISYVLTGVNGIELEKDKPRDKHNLVEGWYEAQNSVEKKGFRIKDLLKIIENDPSISPKLFLELKSMSIHIDELPNAHTIGRNLREFKNINFGGKVMKCIGNDREGHTWYVELIETDN